MRLTNYTADDGQDIGQLHWTPDARAVLYTRGGDLEFLGRPDPNPAADPAGVEQAIWIAAPGEAPRKLAAGHSPAISPKGDRFAYLLRRPDLERPAHESWRRCAAGSRASRSHRRPTPLVPGRRKARLRERPHAITPSSRFTIFPRSPSAISIPAPTGTPTPRGRRTANSSPSPAPRRAEVGVDAAAAPASGPFASLASPMAPAVRSGRQTQARAAPSMPWSPKISSSGPPAIGSSSPGKRKGGPTFTPSPLEGGTAVPLTPGNFEVEHVAYSDDGKQIVYSSNQDDIDRRHLWRVSTAAGPPTALTKGEALEWSPAIVSGGIAFLHADARNPARAAIQLGGTRRRAILRRPRFPPIFQANRWRFRSR